MLSMARNVSKHSLSLVGVFVVCFSYWTYLIFSSQIVFAYDALGYNELGSMIYEQGWLEYFRTGPNREPLYPFTISLSMRLGESLSIRYTYIQRVLQIFILFLTQILLFFILGKLKISRGIKLITIFYFGISPAVVNSAFSLYSEIVIMPFVLAIILFGVLSWRAMEDRSKGHVTLLGFTTALLFLLAVAGKGVFQYILLAYLTPFLALIGVSLVKRKKTIFTNALLYVIIVLAVFQSCFVLFKFMNKTYNGHFEFTDRVTRIFYGNAHKRAEALTPRIILAHLSSIPGGGVCRRFFSEEECRYTEFHSADRFGAMSAGFVSDVSDENKNEKTFQLAFEKIKHQPFQYLLFMAIEALKMPFWESTQIGFVNYPDWLNALFTTGWFKGGLRLAVSLATILSLGYFVYQIYLKRKLLVDFSERGEEVQICFFGVLIIISFTFLYSFFSILTRYALPIVPIYLISIAYGAHRIIDDSSLRRRM